MRSIRESEPAHTRLDAEDVVVGREHVHVGGTVGRLLHNLDLRVVDAGEVAGAGGLVLLGLEREGVRVDTGRGVTGVVVVGLHLVEVLTLLLLETVLAVEDELEGIEGTDSLLGVLRGGNTGGVQRGTNRGHGDEAVGQIGGVEGVGLENNIIVVRRGGEVPQGVLVGGNVGEAPHKLLDGVVVREADLLGTGRGDGVGTSVLDLLDQVLMTLLGEAATLLGVKVHVVGPHLEGLGVEEGGEIGREVDVDAHLVVLEGDEGQVETGVAVEEEDEGQVHGVGGTRGGHLTPSSLLGLIEVQLGVHAPPLLVVLVDALATDGQLDVVDGTLGDPVAVVDGLGSRGVGSERLELDVHVTDEITVTGDSHGHATGVGGSTVDGLLDVLHREVGVALVLGLEEGHLRVTGKVDILGTVSDELHKTASHFESCCTISRENNFGQTRISRPQFFSDQNIMTTYPDEIPEEPVEETDTETEDETEIEEGEIVSGDELEDFDEPVDITELMTSLLATEDGDTVCSALVNIANQLQTQNKILIKMLSKINSA
jgi:hypothetical protein